MERRDFIKTTTAALAALVVGSKIPGISDNPAIAATQTLDFTITDAVKDMVTHNTGLLPNGTRVGPGNPAQCYFWIYKSNVPNLPADCPGPIIFATQGDTITITLRNQLPQAHSFYIKGMFNSGTIPPGATVTKTFRVGASGTYLYWDVLNAPVNRVMGLHGAFIVMPKRAVTGHKYTPYDNPPPNVQQLFDDLGTAPWWPGLGWADGDPSTDTPPVRQNIWVLHQASPKLFAEVGKFNPAKLYPRDTFVRRFLHDAFNPIHDPFNVQASNYIAQYFTISGQSGHFSHNNPWICPYSRVGEPYLIRILNAGLWLHSTHIHANHIFVLQHNNSFDPFPGSQDNPIWVDVYTANPLDTYDWLIPYMRPPDVPNDLGIGRDDLEQSIDVSTTAVDMVEAGTGIGYGLAPGGPPFAPAVIPASVAQLTWPPQQEMQMFIPQVGTRIALAQDGVTPVDCAVRMSPICFPMHDHSEPSQVAQGGNYNCGMISGILFTGDRKGAKKGQTAKCITFADRPTTGDPATPVAHGPDCRQGTQSPSKEFIMPSIP